MNTDTAIRPNLTPLEAAEYLGISRGTLYRLLDSGDLASFTIGRARRIRREVLTEYVASRERAALEAGA